MAQLDQSSSIARICSPGLVAVIRAKDPAEAIALAKACLAGGVTALEVTFTVPDAHEVIRDLVRAHGGAGVVIGAGTVLDAETARTAILAGAQFVVGPCLSRETAVLCNRYSVPYVPGAMTLKEVVEALEVGAQIVKIFPGELFGPKIISAFRGPLPQARLMPTGGVTVENAGDWIAAGAVALGVGGSLTGVAATGGSEAVTRLASDFIAKIVAAKAAKRA